MANTTITTDLIVKAALSEFQKNWLMMPPRKAATHWVDVTFSAEQFTAPPFLKASDDVIAPAIAELLQKCRAEPAGYFYPVEVPEAVHGASMQTYAGIYIACFPMPTDAITYRISVSYGP